MEKVIIFVPEDEPAHAELINGVLTAHSGDAYTLYIQTKLEQYHAEFNKHAPGLVIADLNLPDGNALEILSGNPETQQFPVLIMTY